MAAPIVVMGVSGSGKSTVAEALAVRLHGRYLDGDDFHPAANKTKMHDGVPLTDEDRWPWLQAVSRAMVEQRDGGPDDGGSDGDGDPDDGPVVMACSALKRSYRDVIRGAAPDAIFVCLVGSRELLEQRLSARHGHFMPPSLLDSQLATLQPLGSDERGGDVDISGTADQVVDRALGVVRAAADVG